MQIYSAIKTSGGIREISLQAQHLSKGRIFLTGEINDEMAEELAAQLLYLHQNDISPVIYINSAGGSCTAGLAICDMLRGFPGNVTTVCTGTAASMAAVILSCGTPEKRCVLPHSTVMIHQPLIHQCPGGNASSMQQLSKNLNEMKAVLVDLLSETTGRTTDEINAKIEHGDFHMNATESVDFGLCDSIVSDIYTL